MKNTMNLVLRSCSITLRTVFICPAMETVGTRTLPTQISGITHFQKIRFNSFGLKEKRPLSKRIDLLD
ncbi:MAG: hypothetical protein C4545_01045 [Anaerolineaceae bacterium]|jgi:hypothetical protein|nr:MAG: hypothetical protein C4545_01045 [Anaerolineaceae bacterium]